MFGVMGGGVVHRHKIVLSTLWRRVGERGPLRGVGTAVNRLLKKDGGVAAR